MVWAKVFRTHPDLQARPLPWAELAKWAQLRWCCDSQGVVQRTQQKGDFVGWSGLEAALRRLSSSWVTEGKDEALHGRTC